MIAFSCGIKIALFGHNSPRYGQTDVMLVAREGKIGSRHKSDMRHTASYACRATARRTSGILKNSTLCLC